MFQNFVKVMSSNGNRTECSPIRSVIIRVITKSLLVVDGHPVYKKELFFPAGIFY